MPQLANSRRASRTWGPELGIYLREKGITERQAAEIMGISRDQIRAALGKNGGGRARPITKELFKKLIEATTPAEQLAEEFSAHRL